MNMAEPPIPDGIHEYATLRSLDEIKGELKLKIQVFLAKCDGVVDVDLPPNSSYSSLLFSSTLSFSLT